MLMLAWFWLAQKGAQPPSALLLPVPHQKRADFVRERELGAWVRTM